MTSQTNNCNGLGQMFTDISGVFCLWDDGWIWELVCNKIIDCKGSFYMYYPRLLF